MSRDRSLEEINYTKLLIFFLIFALLCVIIVLCIIVPDIKKYNDFYSRYSKEKANHEIIEKIYIEDKDKLNTYTKENSKITRAFRTNFDEKSFLLFTKNFFEESTLIKIPQKNKDENFTVYELNITSSLDTPKKFYDFLEGLNQYDNIIKTNFPIVMEADRNLIHARFNLSIYRIKSLD